MIHNATYKRQTEHFYLADIDKQAQERTERLTAQMKRAQGITGGGQIVDGNDFKSLGAEHLTESQTADPAKTIDCNFNRHWNTTFRAEAYAKLPRLRIQTVYNGRILAYNEQSTDRKSVV